MAQEIQRTSIRTHWARLYYRVWWTYWNRIVPAWTYRDRIGNRSGGHSETRPTDNLLWMLAVFSRTLRFTQTAAENQDRARLALSARLAYILHNEPGDLLHYDPNNRWHRIPPNHAERGSLAADIQQYMLDGDIPERLFPIYEEILSLEGVESELGLTANTPTLDLAPPKKFILYGHMLRWACHLIRTLHVIPEDREFTEKEAQFMRLVANVARLLQPIPRALVQWKQFDEKAFRRATKPDWSKDPRYLHWFCSIFRPRRHEL